MRIWRFLLHSSSCLSKMSNKTNQGIDNQPIQFHRVYIHNNYTFHSLHLWIVRSNYEGTFAEILNHMKKVLATMHSGLNSLFWGHLILWQPVASTIQNNGIFAEKPLYMHTVQCSLLSEALCSKKVNVFVIFHQFFNS